MSYCKGSLAKILIYQLIDQPGLFQEDFIAQAWEHSPLSFLYDERKKKVILNVTVNVSYPV